MGLIGVTYALAAAAGLLLGGAYTNVPIGALAVGAFQIFFHLSSAVKAVEADCKETLLQMNPLGIALAMGSIICFILAL